MSIELFNEIISGQMEIIDDLNTPSIIWNGNSYACIASVSEFRRDLDDGGFVMNKMLTMSIPLEDGNGNLTFSGGILPSPQEKITYQGNTFRIESKHITPTGAYVRYIAAGVTRGI